MELKISNRIDAQIRAALLKKAIGMHTKLLLGYDYSLLKIKIIVCNIRRKSKLPSNINNHNL